MLSVLPVVLRIPLVLHSDALGSHLDSIHKLSDETCRLRISI